MILDKVELLVYNIIYEYSKDFEGNKIPLCVQRELSVGVRQCHGQYV